MLSQKICKQVLAQFFKSYLFFDFLFRRRSTPPTTSSGRWTPSWSGPSLSGEKSSRSPRTSTMPRSLRNWDGDGSSCPRTPDSRTLRRPRGWGSCIRRSTPTTSTSRGRSPRRRRATPPRARPPRRRCPRRPRRVPRPRPSHRRISNALTRNRGRHWSGSSPSPGTRRRGRPRGRWGRWEASRRDRASHCPWLKWRPRPRSRTRRSAAVPSPSMPGSTMAPPTPASTINTNIMLSRFHSNNSSNSNSRSTAPRLSSHPVEANTRSSLIRPPSRSSTIRTPRHTPSTMPTASRRASASPTSTSSLASCPSTRPSLTGTRSRLTTTTPTASTSRPRRPSPSTTSGATTTTTAWWPAPAAMQLTRTMSFRPSPPAHHLFTIYLRQLWPHKGLFMEARMSWRTSRSSCRTTSWARPWIEVWLPW